MVVPGYGLAAAQAQNAVYQLMEALQSEGKEVKFGIHPVAGRMPGHMNVLLTEADIPYKQLYDMEDINPRVRGHRRGGHRRGQRRRKPGGPKQRTGRPPSPACPSWTWTRPRKSIFVKRSLSPGFAGVDNELFYDQEKTMMLFADANEGLQNIAEAVKNG